MTHRTHKWRNHLYSLRRIRGYQQKQLARLLGYRGTSTVSRLEAGLMLPPLKVALLMELALGARLQEIYVDLAQDLESVILDRATRLPTEHLRSLRARLLRKDEPYVGRHSGPR